MNMKEVTFLGDSLNQIRSFPEDARQDAGFQINKVQNGEAPDDWKPMKTIGRGVREIAIKESSGNYRVIPGEPGGRSVCAPCLLEENSEETQDRC